jgi:cytidyltransferase-like protein
MAIKFITALVETAIEVAREEKELQPSLNETIILEKLHRIMRHGSRNSGVVTEGMDDRYGGRMPVNVYTGRFQPFHLGHLSNLEEAAKRGLRTVICPVKPGKTVKSQANHYFDESIQKEIFARLKAEYGDLIAGIIPIDSPAPQNWVEAIRNTKCDGKLMEPITWTTGEDQKPAYENMIKRYGPDLGLVDNFEVIGLPKNVNAGGGGSMDNKQDIEGREVRKCLINNDIEGFKRQMPQCLWDMYPAMREIMQQYAQPAIMESEAYAKYKKYLNEKIEKLLNEE